ncbi:DUF3325 domain-containing protein [Ottowia thiooxydans]|uniref:DUF3325 domain-containing protein n=1 Tax=Ottowia thiooxydans TaxID=219182 RepID=UPI000687815E|nr:DUF3325 domain-containing protein [Ottowia thiooxydans]
MSTPVLTGAHLGILAISLAGFFALALATERYGVHILGRLPAPRWRQLARISGWLMLLISLAWAIAELEVGVGITLWLGWLSIAALIWVFIFPKWPWQPPARHRAARAERDPKPAQKPTIAPTGESHARRWIALGLLMATIAVYSVGLARMESQPLKSSGALRGTVGPWQFTFAEAHQSPPEVMEMDVPMKEYRLRFCATCDNEIRKAYLKVHKPRSAQATGMGFSGQRWERRVEIPLPSTTRADSELWLTVVGKDGHIHQSAWRMDQVSPATVAWFDEQRRAHAAN